MPIQHIGKCLARHAKPIRCFGHGQSKRLETILADDLAGMRRVKHLHVFRLLSSMVINQIDVRGVSAV
jgi:hypothetical protein